MEIETLPHAASVVLAALQRSRSWRGYRLREAVERAIEILVTLELHGAAQELIARLDAFDGDCDLEEGDNDCSYAAEDDDEPRRYFAHCVPGPAAELFDLEPNIVAPHWHGNGLLNDGVKGLSLRQWRHGMKRERDQ